jgi:hypothetical protein
MRVPPVFLAVFCAAFSAGLSPNAWAHDRSEGKSAFVLDDDGVVAITIEMLELDLPELCHVDLSLSDPLRVQEEEVRLQHCLERGFPHWLRVGLSDAPCPLRFTSWTRTAPKGVRFDATAACPAPSTAKETWRVDWGFFVATRLDHVSIARLHPPRGGPVLVSFSKRNRKAELPLPAARWPWLVAGGAALVGVSTAVAVWRWRRHKRRAPAA